MHRHSGRMLGYGVAALMLAGVLSGCSTGKLGGASAFGSNKLAVAEVSNISSYTADSALGEGRAHFRNKNYGHSAAFYKRAVDVSPKSVEAYIGLGASYDRLRRFDLSDRVYAALYEMTGSTAQYHNNVGYSMMLRGNLPEALRNFRRAEQLDPGNVVVANNLQLLARVTANARA